MTPTEIEAIRARADAATPGPWRTHADVPRAIVALGAPHESLLGLDVEENAIVFSQYDATFIALARTDIPALLDEVARLRREAQRISFALPHNTDETTLRKALCKSVAEVERLRAENTQLTAVIYDLQADAECACITPADRCDCAGCLTARARYGATEERVR